MKKVFAVILHYGDKNLTLRCIESIINNKNKFEEIVVVDNSKNFKFQISNFKFTKLKIIITEKNLGYAGGMNIGIKYALSKNADHVMLLNNDIIFENDIALKLVEFLDRKIDWGIVAPAVKFMRNRKTIYDLGGKIDKIFGKTSHREVGKIIDKNIRNVDYVSGCSMMIKKEVFERIGLLDEKFFLYYEDVDFCLRAKKAGFNTFILPSVSIFHNLSESVGKNSSLAVYHQTKSALLFGSKNYFFKKPLNLLFVFLQSILISLKSYKNIKPAFKAFFDFYK